MNSHRAKKISETRHGYALSESCYSFGYRLRQKYGSLHEGAIKWFAQNCPDYIKTDPPSLLSLGCGNGLFDMDFLSTIRSHYPHMTYTGIDFNRQDLDDFKALAKRSLPGFESFMNWQCGKFDHTTRLDEKYDLITMVHFLHFFDDPLPVIEAARNHLSENGTLLIIQTSEEGIYQVKKEFLDILPNGRFTGSEKIRTALEKKAVNFDTNRVETFLDISILENRSLDSLLLMSFCLANDLTILAREQQDAIRQKFLSLGKVQEDGRQLLCEPLHIITVKAKPAEKA